MPKRPLPPASPVKARTGRKTKSGDIQRPAQRATSETAPCPHCGRHFNVRGVKNHAKKCKKDIEDYAAEEAYAALEREQTNDSRVEVGLDRPGMSFLQYFYYFLAQFFVQDKRMRFVSPVHDRDMGEPSEQPSTG
jgi:hypothetical protein